MIYAFNDTPRQAQGDIAGLLVAGADPRIVSGFATSVAGQTLTVSAGSALLTLNAGSYLAKGLVVGSDAGPQSFDLSPLAPGDYSVWVAFNPIPTDLEARTSYAAQSIGFDQNINIYTRESASFKLSVAAQSPGADYTAIAQVSLPSNVVTDARKLLFEGDAASNFAPIWGSATDRADARGLYPISDLATMLDALKVAIEDIKGTHWWVATGALGASSGIAEFIGATKGHGPPADSDALAGKSYLNLDTGDFYIAE